MAGNDWSDTRTPSERLAQAREWQKLGIKGLVPAPPPPTTSTAMFGVRRAIAERNARRREDMRQALAEPPPPTSQPDAEWNELVRSLVEAHGPAKARDVLRRNFRADFELPPPAKEK
jgi:hypothetical protein